MTGAVDAQGERCTELLIDGRCVPGRAGTFPTINPATEEVLGVAADADTVDMDNAIAAARRAFDETEWSRDTELRVHCLRQLVDALNDGIDDLRRITVAEVGAPVSLTYLGQLQAPIDGLAFATDTALWRGRCGHSRQLSPSPQLRQAWPRAGRGKHRRS